MKGELTISREEVSQMVTAWIRDKVISATNIKITEIKSPRYGAYDPELEIKFTNEEEKVNERPEGD